jgi:hypothetical protein
MIDDTDKPAPDSTPDTATPPDPASATSPTDSNNPPSQPEGANPGVTTELRPTNAEAGEGQTGIVGGADPEARREAAAKDAEHITVAADPEGVTSNRYGGTNQREPTPEELPADAKITPIAEQVNPSAAQSVGAAPQPEEISGVEQPQEGEKNVQPDMSDPTKLLSETSNQQDDAERAAEDANRDVDRNVGP